MWDAPDFRVPYDLNFIPIFDHAHPVITKLPLAFLNVYQHAEKSAHFINHFLEIQQISEFHDLKGHDYFLHESPKNK